MKKVLTAVLALALVLSCSALTALADETPVVPGAYTATKTDATITIDGVMDEAYKDAEVIKLETKLTDTDKSLATGEMRLLWAADAVYAYVTVHDATYAPAYADVTWWDNNDSLWIAMGSNDAISATYCYAIGRSGSVYRDLSHQRGELPQLEFAVVNVKDGKPVQMGTYGNAAGYYPENCQKPEGDVDGYVVELKLPVGGTDNGKGSFGAFICDDIDFAGTDVVNLTEGRVGTSPVVSRGDNGIWQYTGIDGSDFDAKTVFDVLTFKAPSSGGNTGDGGNTGTGDNTGAGDNTGTGDNTGSGDNSGANNTPAGGNEDGGNQNGGTGENPETGVALPMLAVVMTALSGAGVMLSKKK